MKKISDSELKKLIKEKSIYDIEVMYVMGLINMSSKQIDYLLEQKKKNK